MNDPQQSSMGMIAMMLGLIGLIMSLLSCTCSMFLVPGQILSGLGLMFGVVELQRAAAGTVSPDGRPFAIAGAASGGVGCLFGLMWCLGLAAFMVLYVGLIFVSIIAGAAQ